MDQDIVPEPAHPWPAGVRPLTGAEAAELVAEQAHNVDSAGFSAKTDGALLDGFKIGFACAAVDPDGRLLLQATKDAVEASRDRPV